MRKITYQEILKLCNNEETFILGANEIAKKFNFKIIKDFDRKEFRSSTPGIYITSKKYNFALNNPHFFLYTDSFESFNKYRKSVLNKTFNHAIQFGIHNTGSFTLVRDKLLSSSDISRFVQNYLQYDEDPYIMKITNMSFTYPYKISEVFATWTLSRIKQHMINNELFSTVLQSHKKNDKE